MFTFIDIKKSFKIEVAGAFMIFEGLRPFPPQMKMFNPKMVDFTLIFRNVTFKFGLPDPAPLLLSQARHLGYLSWTIPTKWYAEWFLKYIHWHQNCTNFLGTHSLTLNVFYSMMLCVHSLTSKLHNLSSTRWFLVGWRPLTTAPLPLTLPPPNPRCPPPNLRYHMALSF